MEIKTHLTTILAIFISSSINLSEEVDFCQSFLANNNSINYGYQHEIAGYYFFIDSNYWRLVFNSSSNTFAILTENIKNNKIFGNNTVFAFTTKICEDSNCGTTDWRTGLYRNSVIKWFKVLNNPMGELNVQESPDISTFFQTAIEPILAFHLISEPILCVVLQKESKNERVIQFIRDYLCYGFDKQYNIINKTDRVINVLKKKMDTIGLPYKSDDTILNNIEHSRQVVAIFDSGESYAFFNIKNKKIQYCLSYGILFNKGCKGVPKLLIDCSIGVIRPVSVPFYTTTDDSAQAFNSTDFEPENNSTGITFVSNDGEEGLSTTAATTDTKSDSSYGWEFILLMIVLAVMLLFIIAIGLFIVFKLILTKEMETINRSKTTVLHKSEQQN